MHSGSQYEASGVFFERNRAREKKIHHTFLWAIQTWKMNQILVSASFACQNILECLWLKVCKMRHCTVIYKNENADDFRCLFSDRVCVALTYPESECHYWKTLGENQMTSMLFMSSERNWESQYFSYYKRAHSTSQNIPNTKWMQNRCLTLRNLYTI